MYAIRSYYGGASTILSCSARSGSPVRTVASQGWKLQPDGDQRAFSKTRWRAANGTALSPLPLTGPSHTTMLTGLYPERHGALANGIQLEEDVRTLPEALERAGYGTAGFISGWLV